jgi:hypothetical protein
MEKRKAIEAADADAATNPDNASGQTQLKIDLPAVESPSISPAEIVGATSSAVDTTAGPSETGTAAAEMKGSAAMSDVAAPKQSRFILRPRHKRYAVLAASVVVAGAIGAIVGAAAVSGSSKPPAIDVATVEENKAMQQSVARLTKEIASLKSSLETANKSASTQIAKITERLNRENAGVTGSVAPAQSAQPAPQAAAPLPAKRPETGPAEPQQSARPTVLTDWSIRETRDGYIYVQGHGDVYQVVPGAPLPGLGPVEQIKRQDGRWLIVTPKGIIVSMRDRRYFEQF